MRAFKVFIFGLLYGWFIKFAIDRIYRGNKIEDIRHENVSLKEYVRSLETQLQSKSLESISVTRTVAQPRPMQTAKAKDDLKQIRGIGPATEKKLNDAGINTFADLAQLTRNQLQNILGSSQRIAQSAGNFITQAKKLVQQKPERG